MNRRVGLSAAALSRRVTYQPSVLRVRLALALTALSSTVLKHSVLGRIKGSVPSTSLACRPRTVYADYATHALPKNPSPVGVCSGASTRAREDIPVVRLRQQGRVRSCAGVCRTCNPAWGQGFIGAQNMPSCTPMGTSSSPKRARLRTRYFQSAGTARGVSRAVSACTSCATHTITSEVTITLSTG